MYRRRQRDSYRSLVFGKEQQLTVATDRRSLFPAEYEGKTSCQVL
jgi:hypothetical protein